jgi:hypothetical protein
MTGTKGLGRARTVATVALLAALGAGWIATSRMGATAMGSAPAPRPSIQVERERVGSGSVRAAYADAVRPIASRTRSGPVGCAHGDEDERAWSAPPHPRRVAGRFTCRYEKGRAAMWWSDNHRGLLTHAIASDDDLASLFAWWLAHSER